MTSCGTDGGALARMPITDAALHDQAAEALAHKVTLSINESCERRFPAETPVRVTIHARGKAFESAITTPRGDANDRPSWDDRIGKFDAATRASLAPDDKARLSDAFAAVRDGKLMPLRTVLASPFAPTPALR